MENVVFWELIWARRFAALPVWTGTARSSCADVYSSFGFWAILLAGLPPSIAAMEAVARRSPSDDLVCSTVTSHG